MLKFFHARHLPWGNEVCKLYVGQKMIFHWLHPLTFFYFKVLRDDWIQVAWSSVFLMRKGTRWKPTEGTITRVLDRVQQNARS